MKRLKRIISVLLSLMMLSVCISIGGCSSDLKERESDNSKTLYVGYVGTSFPSSYMPWQSRDGIAPTVSSMIYSTLFSYDDFSQKFTPVLGKEWYYMAHDGTPILTEDGDVDYAKLEAEYSSASYIPVKVILNENATWSDGEKVTGDDIYFSFDLCADKTRSNHAGSLAWVTGSLEHTYTSGKLTSTGIYTKNHDKYHKYNLTEDNEVILHVSRSLGSITTLFTTVLILPEHRYGSIVSKERPINSTTPDDVLSYEYQHPIGCGPFELDTELSNSQVIILKRRENYHMKDDDGSPYYKVDKIKFILYQEENVAIFSLLKGYIDVLDTSINPNYKSLFENEEKIQLIEAKNNFCQTLVLNLNPQKNEKNEMRDLLSITDFRKAIALAVNQEDLIKNVQNGAASTYAAGLVSSELTDLYNPESDILSGDYTERLNEANTLLDGIVPEKDSRGYRLLNGKRVSYEILGASSVQDLVSYLQVQLQKIGIEVEYGASGSSPEKTYFYTSKFDMTFQSVTFSSTTIDIMFKSHFVSLGETSNYGRLVNDEMADKIAEMTSTINQERKNELAKEVQLMIAESYYKIPLYSSNVISVARTDRFTGWQTRTGQNTFNDDSLHVLEWVGGND